MHWNWQSGLKSEGERPCASWGRALSLLDLLTGFDLLCALTSAVEFVAAIA